MVKIPQHKVTKFNKFFRASFSHFLSNPTEYLQRLSMSNPANQLKDFGEEKREYKNTKQLNFSGLLK